MILKPSNISPDNHTFPSSELIDITWTNNGDTMVAFEVIIKNNSDQTQVYDSGKISNYTPRHIVPANTLTNGIEYCFTITVYNSNNDSVVSDSKILKCSSRPIVSITTDGYIRNQIATVIATYSQAENITVKCYQFSLFDISNNLIEQSDYIYDDNLVYTFSSLLTNEEQYNIECEAITQNDISSTSGKVTITVEYIAPIVSVLLTTETDDSKPSVKLNWHIIRILGTHEGTTSYIDNEKIDTTNGKVIFDDGFNLTGDFTFYVWAENIQENETLIELFAENIQILIKYYDNKVHVFKLYNGYIMHICSDSLGEITSTTQIMIRLQQINKYLNVYSEVVV